MASLTNSSQPQCDFDVLEKNKLQLALKFLRENPNETPKTAIQIWKIEKPNTLQKKWLQEKKRMGRIK
jgi:hypothetical protein